MATLTRSDAHALTDQSLKLNSCVDFVGPMEFTVQDVLNISESKYSMLEKLSNNDQKISRKPIIRQVESGSQENENENDNSNLSSSNWATYKLLLEDMNNVRVFAYNTTPIKGLAMVPKKDDATPIVIGSKLTLKKFTTKHGVILFEQANIHKVTAPDPLYPANIYEKVALERLTKDIDGLIK